MQLKHLSHCERSVCFNFPLQLSQTTDFGTVGTPVVGDVVGIGVVGESVGETVGASEVSGPISTHLLSPVNTQLSH